MRVFFQLKSVGASLSTRQLLRVAKRLARYPNEDLYNTVQKACLGRLDSSLYFGQGLLVIMSPDTVDGHILAR